MDPLVQELRELLAEQTEPYQRKMKAKHSRLKKRVIGHGNQPAGAPYSEKPSMERSKSAPPIGEHIVKQGSEYCLKSKKSGKNLGCYPSRKGAEKRERQVQYFKHVNEGLFDKLKKTVGIAPQDSDRYNQIGSSNIYVGEQPVMGSSFMLNIVDRFDKVYLVAEETIKQLTPQEMESQKGKVVSCPTHDTSTPTKDQLEKMEQIAQSIANESDSAFVLVACKAGMNRSAAIAARALVLKAGITVVQDEQQKEKVNEIIQTVISSRTPAITMGSPGVLKYDMRTNREKAELHGTPHEAFINFIMYGTNQRLTEFKKQIKKLVIEMLTRYNKQNGGLWNKKIQTIRL